MGTYYGIRCSVVAWATRSGRFGLSEAGMLMVAVQDVPVPQIDYDGACQARATCQCMDSTGHRTEQFGPPVDIAFTLHDSEVTSAHNRVAFSASVYAHPRDLDRSKTVIQRSFDALLLLQTLLICSGVSLACSGAIIEYQWHGILLCMGASVASAFRWVSSQFAMSREDLGIDDPITLVYAVMPQMSVFLFVLSLIFERPWVTLPESPYFASGLSILVTLILVSVGSVLAFGLVNIEYKIVKEFSALTLSIAGQVKEAFTILCSVLIFGDPLSAANVIGLGVVMIGVLLYRKAKIEMKEDRDARSQSRRLQPSPEPSAPPLPSAAQKAAVAAATARSTRVKDKKPGPAFVVNMSREGSFE
eukprot:scaffold990_cov393-Prasinococcus_capsulatus_cf.AAC.25